MKGPSVRGARRLTSGGVLEQYGEHALFRRLAVPLGAFGVVL